MMTNSSYPYEIPEVVLKKWQEIVDLLAEHFSVPAALIMRTDDEYMEVLISSDSENNPYHPGDKEKWYGLYCETVIKSQNKLLVPNATKDKNWDKNPDIKLGMISYLGLPINYPDNHPFGTICVLDNKENPFSSQFEKLMLRFKNLVELDIAFLLTYNDNLKEYKEQQTRLLDKNLELQGAYERRKESEEKFYSLYANMSEGSAMHTLVYNDQGIPEDYLIVEVNSAFESQLGISREAVINKTSKEAYGVDEPPYFEIYSRVALTGISEVFETYFPPLDKYFSISVYCPYKGSFATIFGNITERKKAEQELRIILTKHQVLFEILPIGITISDASGKIVESNQIVESILGISREEQERRKIGGQEWQIIRPDGTKMPPSEFASVMALEHGRPITNVEMGIIKDDNQITWINVSASPIPLEGYGVVIVYSDITESKLAEKTIKKSEEKYRLIAENTSDVIWIFNLTKQKFTFISPSIYNLRGYTVEEAIAQTLEESLTEESLKLVNENVQKTLPEFLDHRNTNQSRQIIELQQTCKTGDVIWVEIASQYQFNSDGEIEVIGVSRNIGKRKKIEHELLRNEAQLKELNASKDRFFSIIAHDLKGPIGNFHEATEILYDSESGLSEVDRNKLLNTVRISAKNIYYLLENLLEWALAQSGKLQFNPTIIDLCDLSDDMMQLFASKTMIKKITLVNNINDSVWVKADTNLLNAILRNLISNAIKFTKEGGVVELNAVETTDAVQISVKDSGLGMTKEQVNGLFNLDSSSSTRGTKDEKGTGLGLILCKEFVEKHNGKIWVESEIGIGSTFHFILPK